MTELPDGEHFIQLLEFKGRIYVGSNRRVFRVEDDVIVPLDLAILPELTASEALFAFCGWLTSRREVVSMGSSQLATPVIELLSAFIKSQELSPPREHWHEKIKPYPKEKDDGEKSDGSVELG